ncbi:GtrA family protein [Candidatus Magnetominusculus xianensis]|uniref:Glycosyl transferase family 2 n=1 Tax=Candidatus Magnetominusculus xianensis TaxID=1748249 RepID=A0ABR5SG11_9BACT|nr:GtrA family protein [Candidatus Magnetominusculus xianensis]KWT86952.1 glycosyl transferase family 2 [Candidatus Magnetominusculus xianensis]MBF0403924.1 GtrA family protein [Nitrospirota bacterium]
MAPGAKNIKQFISFALIGVLNTFVDLLVLNIETVITGMKTGTPYALQKGISFLFGVACSYYFNKRWAFKDKSTERQGVKFSIFMIISVVGALINVAVAAVSVTYLRPILNYEVLSAQVWVNIGALLGTAAALAWNFLGYKFFVFK